MSNKIISFSLWGNNPRYLIGAKRNIEEARRVYPDWKCRFYIDDSVNMDHARSLHDMGSEVYKVNNLRRYHGMFWRFLPASDPTVDVVIVRDADSRVNEREAAAVSEWLDSDYGFHILRDHPHHVQVILGGLWGAKRGVIPNIGELINRWGHFNNKGIDQVFLEHAVFPIIKNNYLAHDDDNANRQNKLINVKPFPTHAPLQLPSLCKLTGTKNFCGSIFDADDTPGIYWPY